MQLDPVFPIRNGIVQHTKMQMLATPATFQRFLPKFRFVVPASARVRKARGVYPILDAADLNAGRLERAFLRVVELVRDAIPLSGMAQLLERGNLTGLFELLDLENRLNETAKGSGVSATETSFLEALQRAFKDGAEAELKALQDVQVQKATIGTAMSFDLLNPETISFLQSYTFNLIREVSKDTRLAIQDMVTEAFREGGHPYEQAREIKHLIGLTQKQAQAVRNFRKALEGGDPAQLREVLNRALRDKRFDPSILNAIKTQTALPKAKIDEMVYRYYQRFVVYRARNIARTESLRASHHGQQALWEQAQKQGLLKPERTRRKWLVTPDDRLCERCRPIPKMNPEGVELQGGMFQTPDGPILMPPLHPSCRCTTALHFLPRKK